jgi:hypothetical protein
VMTVYARAEATNDKKNAMIERILGDFKDGVGMEGFLKAKERGGWTKQISDSINFS